MNGTGNAELSLNTIVWILACPTPILKFQSISVSDRNIQKSKQCQTIWSQVEKGRAESKNLCYKAGQNRTALEDPTPRDKITCQLMICGNYA